MRKNIIAMSLILGVVLITSCTQQQDNFVPIIEDLLARGIGKIMECNEDNVKYFYGPATTLPAVVMYKVGNNPWEARPGIPNRAAGSLVKEADILDLAVNPENCDEVYVATNWAEAYKTKNGGIIWEEIEEINLLPSSHRVNWGVATINPKNTKHIVIGVARPIHSEATGYYLHQSLDGGQSFLPIERYFGREQPLKKDEINKIFE